jgi:hypothetical protein
MVPETDWRLAFGALHLRGARFHWKAWYPPSEDWDHDHCIGYSAKFMLHEGCLSEGYAVTGHEKFRDDYHWVCKSCFEDLKENLGWQEISK